jgi:hypothetical protein
VDGVSIRLEEEGPIIAIRMTRRILGIPLFKVYAFSGDGLLIDTGSPTGKEDLWNFLIASVPPSWLTRIIMRIIQATITG